MLQEQENVQFGQFTANLHAGELKKGQNTVPLQNLPFRLLAVLLREPGRVYSRDELRQELWPAGTFVDFERGISTAVNKLREALGDSANNSRFIETVGRRGYRFIAPVAAVPLQTGTSVSPGALGVSPAVDDVPGKPAATQITSRVSPGRRTIFFAVAILIMVLAVVAFERVGNPHTPKIKRIEQLTNSGRAEPAGGLFFDGSRLFFVERSGPHWTLMQTSAAGGEVVPVQAPFPDPILLAFSPDHTQMLMTSRGQYLDKHALWILPIQGGTPRRVGDLMVDVATWFPDGQRLLCASDREIFSVERDGTQRRHLFNVDGGPFRLTWRPDGLTFRFSLTQNNDVVSLWEASADGTNVHPLLPGWNENANDCCGSWSPDGRNYVFRSGQNGQEDLWLLHEETGWPWAAKPKPIRLTNGPTSFSEPVISPDGKRIFATGLQSKLYVARQDRPGQFSRAPLPPAADLAYSHDGKWVAYIGVGLTLWRSRVDGSERSQLTTSPLLVLRPRWSPDDKKILLMARHPKEGYAPYIIPAEGGKLEPIMEKDDLSHDHADWSPDQQSVVVGLSLTTNGKKVISMVNLATHQVAKLPASEGLLHPLWSPKGNYISAMSEDLKKLFIYDFRSGEWKQLASAILIRTAHWDNDGTHLFYQDYRAIGQAVFRVDVAHGTAEKVMDCSTFENEGATSCTFEGRAPDGALMVSVMASWANLFAFDVDLP